MGKPILDCNPNDPPQIGTETGFRFIFVPFERIKLGTDQVGHLCFEKSDSHVPRRCGSIYFLIFVPANTE